MQQLHSSLVAHMRLIAHLQCRTKHRENRDATAAHDQLSQAGGQKTFQPIQSLQGFGAICTVLQPPPEPFADWGKGAGVIDAVFDHPDRHAGRNNTGAGPNRPMILGGCKADHAGRGQLLRFRHVVG